jgi:hypothetical protein
MLISLTVNTIAWCLLGQRVGVAHRGRHDGDPADGPGRCQFKSVLR